MSQPRSEDRRRMFEQQVLCGWMDGGGVGRTSSIQNKTPALVRMAGAVSTLQSSQMPKGSRMCHAISSRDTRWV